MPFLREKSFRLEHQFARAAPQRSGDLEDHDERGHVLTAFDLAHVRTLDAGPVGQRFLGDAVFRSRRAHGSAEGLRRGDLIGRRSDGPSSLPSNHGLKLSSTVSTRRLRRRILLKVLAA